MIRGLALVMIVATAPALASAQSLGAFRWQLQPYCNVVTLTVSQVGGVFTLDGFDDQCGTDQRASVTGAAFPNPDGTIGIGLTIVTTPAGTPLHVDIALSLASISGPWRDSAGGIGTFAFSPASVNGTPRPTPTSPTQFPGGFLAGQTSFAADGGFVSRGTEGVGTIPATGPGARVVWYPAKAAFRAGRAGFNEWNDASVGLHSIALGSYPIASGIGSIALGHSAAATGVYSLAAGIDTGAAGAHSTAIGSATSAPGAFATALGRDTTASGGWSTAFGRQTTASGTQSTAWGASSTASGASSTAGGENAMASGNHALALGLDVTASGHASIALGKNVSTANRNGSFIFGDDSGVASTVATAANQFVVRATGGVRFLTSTNLFNGCEIAPTTGNFICTGTITSTSDRRRKHEVALLDGEDVLDRVARIPVTTWSFIDEPGVRHAGPMAQDFHAAFGLGENDVTISYVDINGINMRAIQALEQRTRELMNEVAALREQLRALDQRRPAR